LQDCLLTYLASRAVIYTVQPQVYWSVYTGITEHLVSVKDNKSNAYLKTNLPQYSAGCADEPL